MKDTFRRVACWTAERCGMPSSFFMAVAVVIVWAATGPVFHFSDTWQLVINTGTTIVTFLMVFLIQNTQNRDAKAMQLKLDEVIRAMSHARNELVDLENQPDEQIEELKREFGAMRKHIQPNGAPEPAKE
jgi:low affinity Fe/Cu permease